MYNKLTIVLTILALIIYSQVACATTKLACAGCRLNDAYTDQKALSLVKAAVEGDAEKVSELVKSGANPNYLEEGKIPILLWTLCANNLEGFEALLKAGADPNLSGNGHGLGNGRLGGLHAKQSSDYSSVVEGWSAVRFASQVNDIRFLQLSIKYGGNVNAPKGNRPPKEPLLAAAEYGLLDHIKLLIESGADINSHSLSDSGPVAAIRGLGRYDIAVWFLENGFSYNLSELAVMAELSAVSDSLRPYKEKLIDLLISKGIKFPNPKGAIARALKNRQIPEKDVMELVYGRRTIFDYPMKPGLVDDRYK